MSDLEKDESINIEEELAALEHGGEDHLKHAMYVVGKATGVLARIPAGLYEWRTLRTGKTAGTE